MNNEPYNSYSVKISKGLYCEGKVKGYDINNLIISWEELHDKDENPIIDVKETPREIIVYKTPNYNQYTSIGEGSLIGFVVIDDRRERIICGGLEKILDLVPKKRQFKPKKTMKKFI